MKLRDLVTFIRENRGRAAQMDDALLLPYLVFHLRCRGIKWIIEDGKLTGLAVGRRLKNPPEDNQFSWDDCCEDGDYFVVGDIIATTPAALSQLADYFLETWPTVKHVYGHDKDGKIKPLSRKFIRRLKSVDDRKGSPSKEHRERDQRDVTSSDQRPAGATCQ